MLISSSIIFASAALCTFLFKEKMRFLPCFSLTPGTSGLSINQAPFVEPPAQAGSDLQKSFPGHPAPSLLPSPPPPGAEPHKVSDGSDSKPVARLVPSGSLHGGVQRCNIMLGYNNS